MICIVSPVSAGIGKLQNLSVTAACGTCHYNEQELSSFHYNADADLVREPLHVEVIQPLGDVWQQFVKHSLIPWEAVKHKSNGRGIVIIGGGTPSVKRIKVDGIGGSKMIYCGHTFGQAYPDHEDGDGGGGIAFLHGGALKTMSAPPLSRLIELNGGIFTHFKRISATSLEDWTRVESGVAIKLWSAGFYYNLTQDYDPSDLIM